ncbi:MAG TPA: class I SAM-dependent methyltransferase [Pseudolabrys sp.]|nr:class I SAM-dependent methyltransferase [Pseudolabrys sp.]
MDSAVFEQHATVASWDEDYYHPISELYYDRAIATMLRLMDVPSGARVLDAGCGPGVHSVRVARAGHPVLAIDISRTMLDEARARLTAAGLSSLVDFRQENLMNLSFADGSFRYIFSWGVIIHIPDATEALAELARILEPGGTLALYVTNRTALDHKIESVARFLVRKPLDQERLQLGNGAWYQMHGQKLWLWQFDIPELERALAKHGLKLANRIIGEFSEVQRRVHGPLRRTLLRWNNLCYRLKLPPTCAAANLLIFRKNIS